MFFDVTCSITLDLLSLIGCVTPLQGADPQKNSTDKWSGAREIFLKEREAGGGGGGGGGGFSTERITKRSGLKKCPFQTMLFLHLKAQLVTFISCVCVTGKVIIFLERSPLAPW